MIIRWGFELDNEHLKKKKTELVKEGLAQWLICKETLTLLSQKIIDELTYLIDTHRNYRKEPKTSRENV